MRAASAACRMRLDRRDVADVEAQRVEVGGVALRDAEQRQARLERDRLAVDARAMAVRPSGP